jgi:Arc/MetJ-type ribon-helix-helix transcriptional regulator
MKRRGEKGSPFVMKGRLTEEERQDADELIEAGVAVNDSELVRKGIECMKKKGAA